MTRSTMPGRSAEALKVSLRVLLIDIGIGRLSIPRSVTSGPLAEQIQNAAASPLILFFFGEVPLCGHQHG